MTFGCRIRLVEYVFGKAHTFNGNGISDAFFNSTKLII